MRGVFSPEGHNWPNRPSKQAWYESVRAGLGLVQTQEEKKTVLMTCAGPEVLTYYVSPPL